MFCYSENGVVISFVGTKNILNIMTPSVKEPLKSILKMKNINKLSISIKKNTFFSSLHQTQHNLSTLLARQF